MTGPGGSPRTPRVPPFGGLGRAQTVGGEAGSGPLVGTGWPSVRWSGSPDGRSRRPAPRALRSPRHSDVWSRTPRPGAYQAARAAIRFDKQQASLSYLNTHGPRPPTPAAYAGGLRPLRRCHRPLRHPCRGPLPQKRAVVEPLEIQARSAQGWRPGRTHRLRARGGVLSDPPPTSARSWEGDETAQARGSRRVRRVWVLRSATSVR